MRVFAPIASVAARRRCVAASLLTLIGTASCLDFSTTVNACKITAAPGSLTLAVNQVAAIVGTAFDCSGNTITKKTITYSSANSEVATVTNTGQVIAIAVGNTTVSANADGQSASIQVTVTPEVAASVTINPPTATLRRTNTRQFSAIARNAQQVAITGAQFRWTSSNSAIASVDATGRVTALTAGTVTVTADVNNVFGAATVNVTEIPIGSCSLAPTTYKVTTGQSAQPTLALRDTASGALTTLGRPVAWASDNENVATVSQTGLITTRKAGTAKISASSVEYPSVTCSVNIEAVDPRIAQVVITPRTGSLRIGIPRGLGATLLDSVSNVIASGRVITWTSATPTVAQVSQAGIVTGIALGTARVIASSEGVADTVTFPVTKIPVGNITTTPLQVSLLEGGKVQLTATVTDSAGTTVTDRPIEWLSSDPTKATVSATGLVIALAAGAVQVGATTEGKLAQSTILIQQIPADSVTVSDTIVRVTKGQVTAFAINVIDAQRNTLRNRNVVVASTAPGFAIGALLSASIVQVQGIAVGEAVLVLQVVNANNQNEGKASRVRVIVTAPIVTPPASDAERRP